MLSSVNQHLLKFNNETCLRELQAAIKEEGDDFTGRMVVAIFVYHIYASQKRLNARYTSLSSYQCRAMPYDSVLS